jgi:hypothetical protein
MIPSALAGQLQQGLADFLRFSFWLSNSCVFRKWLRLISSSHAIS